MMKVIMTRPEPKGAGPLGRGSAIRASLADPLGLLHVQGGRPPKPVRPLTSTGGPNHHWGTLCCCLRGLARAAQGSQRGDAAWQQWWLWKWQQLKPCSLAVLRSCKESRKKVPHTVSKQSTLLCARPAVSYTMLSRAERDCHPWGVPSSTNILHEMLHGLEHVGGSWPNAEATIHNSLAPSTALLEAAARSGSRADMITGDASYVRVNRMGGGVRKQ